jgi:hypothetical protein
LRKPGRLKKRNSKKRPRWQRSSRKLKRKGRLKRKEKPRSGGREKK